MKTSEQIDQLSAALAKAQAVIKHPGKHRTVAMELRTGGKVKYSYADLADVLDVCREPLGSNGLAVVQTTISEPGMVGVVTRLVHESGQWIESTLCIALSDNKPQTMGSAITYLRRYSLAPMVGIASDEDEDGSIAQGVDVTTERKQQQEQKPQQQKQQQQQKPQTIAAKPQQDGIPHAGIYTGSTAQNEVIERILEKNDVPKEFWSAIAAGLLGKPSTELYAVIANVRKTGKA